MNKKMLSKQILISCTLVFLFMIYTTVVIAGWSEMDSGTDQNLNGVWGSSGSDVYAVGGKTIIHYDGSTWSQVESSAPEILMDISGSSASNIFVVGYYGTILYYDGSIWSVMECPETEALESESHLQGVWASSGTDVFVVAPSSILHYNGSNWSEMESNAGYWSLTSIWGTSPADVFAVGHYSGGRHLARILHYDGNGWSEMYSGTEWDLTNVWGTSSTDVFASGSGTILHYDGGEWSEMEASENWKIQGIWGTSPTDVFAVGSSYEGDIIVYYDGSTWSNVYTGEGIILNDIWGTSSSDIFAVGDHGRILHYNEIEATTTTTATASDSTTTTDGGGCPAGKIYGEYSKETELLRYFRDNLLSKTSEGQELIKLYYQWSPAIVRAMEENKEFKTDVREIFDGVLPLIRTETE